MTSFSASNRPKKILVLCNGARILYLTRFELLKALRDRGDTVYLSTPRNSAVSPFREIGCQIIETPLDRRGLTPKEDFKLWCKYKQIIRDIRPDLVLTFTIKPNIYGIRAATKYGIPGIPTMTGLGTSIQKRGLLQKVVFFLYRHTFRKVPRAFFQNSTNAELFRLLDMIRPEQIVQVAGSGVNLETHPFEPYPEPGKPTRFLFIGRLMREKGIFEYLEAARRIHSASPEVRFGILGFREEPNILSQIRSLEEEGVVDYFGYVKDVRPYIAESHAVVLPSWHEGMANVLLEAAAAGRPVLASKIAGCVETFNEGVTGYGFMPRSADDLCAKLNRFLALPYEKRAEMGKAARTKVEHEFDRAEVVAAYLAEIDRLFEPKS